MDSSLIKAVGFSNSMNQGSLPTGEHENRGADFKLSLQPGQVWQRQLH